MTSKALVGLLARQQLRLLPAGTTSCRVGIAPTEDPCLITAHIVPSQDVSGLVEGSEGTGPGVLVARGPKKPPPRMQSGAIIKHISAARILEHRTKCTT